MTFILVGCIATQKHAHGNASINDPALVAQVEKGKSTKPDVRRILGDPAAVDFTDAGFEKWVYTYISTEIGGSAFNLKSETNSKSLTVQFDKDGVVMNVGAGQTEDAHPEPKRKHVPDKE